MRYNILIVLALAAFFTQKRIIVRAETSRHDVSVVLSEMAAEIRELKSQLAQLKTDMTKMSGQSQETTRIEKLETEVQTLNSKVFSTKSDKATTLDKITDKVDRLDQKIEHNTEYLTNLADNAESFCSCGNVTWNNTWNACASGPCPSGSTCLNVNGGGSFVCLCPDGSFGPTCSESYADTTFLATSSSVLIVNGGSPIIFDEARINPGSNYDTTTGLYHVPITGIYTFTVHLTSNGYDHITYQLSVDGEPVAYTDMYNYHDKSFTLEKSLTLNLAAHQTVSVVPASGLGIYGSPDGVMWSYFTGHLLYQLNTPDPK